MRKIFSVLLVWLLPLVVNSQTSPHRQTPLAFTQVTVLDMMGGSAKPDMTVVVSGNRITAVQNSRKANIPKGAKVVDAKGKFILPGLWDMYAYTLGQQGLHTDNFFHLFIAHGITGVRDMGNSPLSMTQVRHLRTQIVHEERPGPRIMVSGPLLEGSFSGWTSTVIVTSEQKGRRWLTLRCNLFLHPTEEGCQNRFEKDYKFQQSPT